MFHLQSLQLRLTSLVTGWTVTYGDSYSVNYAYQRFLDNYLFSDLRLSVVVWSESWWSRETGYIFIHSGSVWTPGCVDPWAAPGPAAGRCAPTHEDQPGRLRGAGRAGVSTSKDNPLFAFPHGNCECCYYTLGNKVSVNVQFSWRLLGNIVKQTQT